MSTWVICQSWKLNGERGWSGVWGILMLTLSKCISTSNKVTMIGDYRYTADIASINVLRFSAPWSAKINIYKRRLLMNREYTMTDQYLTSNSHVYMANMCYI